jgi:hypothetical protein
LMGVIVIGCAFSKPRLVGWIALVICMIVANRPRPCPEGDRISQRLGHPRIYERAEEAGEWIDLPLIKCTPLSLLWEIQGGPGAPLRWDLFVGLASCRSDGFWSE